MCVFRYSLSYIPCVRFVDFAPFIQIFCINNQKKSGVQSLNVWFMFFTFQRSNHEDAGHVHEIGHVCLRWRFSLDEVLKNGAGLLLKLLKLAPLESLWPFLLLRHLFIGEKEPNFLFIFLSCASLIDRLIFGDHSNVTSL